MSYHVFEMNIYIVDLLEALREMDVIHSCLFMSFQYFYWIFCLLDRREESENHGLESKHYHKIVCCFYF